MRLISTMESWPRGLSIGAGAALVVVVGFLDYVTGYQLSFSAFYLLPIFVLAWFGGKWPGCAGALACTAARTVADVLAGRPFDTPFFPSWNTGMRLIIYMVMALLVITVKRQVEQERSIARVDPLTGAATTRAFLEAAQAERDRSRRYNHPFTVAYIDLDNFKAINDTWGHAEGDRTLRIVVSVIRSTIRSTDVIGRLGGDEFAILFTETDETAAATALEKVQARLDKEAREHDWPIGLSAGSVTVTGASEINLDDLIAAADRRMYEAKRRRKGNADK